MFIRIDGKQRCQYRAVDEDGQVLDILMQTRRNTKAAVCFFRRLLKQQGQAQRFLAVHDAMRNLFAIPRHLLRAKIYRVFHAGAFELFERVMCA